MDILVTRKHCSALISSTVLVLSGMTMAWGMGKKKAELMSNKGMLALKADANLLPGGEKILIHCSLTNLGDVETRVLVMPSVNVDLQILSKEGRWTDLPLTILRDVHIGKDSIFTVKPNEAYSFDVRIDRRYYEWPATGTYEARMVYRNALEKVESVRLWIGQVESNTLKIEF
jgi:hypothetical protein